MPEICEIRFGIICNFSTCQKPLKNDRLALKCQTCDEKSDFLLIKSWKKWVDRSGVWCFCNRAPYHTYTAVICEAYIRTHKLMPISASRWSYTQSMKSLVFFLLYIRILTIRINYIFLN